jgi:hypothetical protein
MEIAGPAVSGTYNARVMCNGETIGWTGHGAKKAVREEAAMIVERHQNGTTVVEVDPVAIRAEIEAEARPKPRELSPVEVPMTQADVDAYERERKAHNEWVREDNEKKQAEALKQIAKETNEANRRAREARRRTVA